MAENFRQAHFENRHSQLPKSGWHSDPNKQSAHLLFLSISSTRSGCTDVFRESLDYLDSLIGLYGYDNDVIILGDINADPGSCGGPMTCKPSNEQGKILLKYLKRWNFMSAHLHLSPSLATATYESEAWKSARKTRNQATQSALLTRIPNRNSEHNLDDTANTSGSLLLRAGPEYHRLSKAFQETP